MTTFSDAEALDLYPEHLSAGEGRVASSHVIDADGRVLATDPTCKIRAAQVPSTEEEHVSFSANWGTQNYDVCAADANEDLVLEKALLSPPLESMAADVRAVVEEAARVAAGMVVALDAGAGRLYRVSAGGHVRQGENDSGTVNVSVAEIVREPAKPEESAADEATPGSDAATADEQMGPL